MFSGSFSAKRSEDVVELENGCFTTPLAKFVTLLTCELVGSQDLSQWKDVNQSVSELIDGPRLLIEEHKILPHRLGSSDQRTKLSSESGKSLKIVRLDVPIADHHLDGDDSIYVRTNQFCSNLVTRQNMEGDTPTYSQDIRIRNLPVGDRESDGFHEMEEPQSTTSDWKIRLSHPLANRLFATTDELSELLSLR